MRFFQSMPTERFVNFLIASDREILQMCMGWEIEKEEVAMIIIDHFKDMGIFSVKPYQHQREMRSFILHFLNHSKIINGRREAIQREIAKAREKSRGRTVE